MRARLTSAVVLVFQLFLTAALPVADAVAESRSESAVSHVERFGGDDCAPGHQVDQCALCQILRAPFSGDVAKTQCYRSLARLRVADAVLDAVIASRWLSTTSPRAPPVV